MTTSTSAPVNLCEGLTVRETPNGSILVDSEGAQVRYEPHQVQGRGWTVAKVIGSRRTGRTVRIAEGFEQFDYPLAVAQHAADVVMRDIYRWAPREPQHQSVGSVLPG